MAEVKFPSEMSELDQITDEYYMMVAKWNQPIPNSIKVTKIPSGFFDLLDKTVPVYDAASKMLVNSPIKVNDGAAEVETPAAGDESKKVSNTAFVQAAIKAAFDDVEAVKNVSMGTGSHVNDLVIEYYDDRATSYINLPTQYFLQGVEYNAETKIITFHLVDGSTFQINISDLVDVYVASASGGLEVTGAGKNEFGIKTGGIVETMLSAAIKEKLNQKFLTPAITITDFAVLTAADLNALKIPVGGFVSFVAPSGVLNGPWPDAGFKRLSGLITHTSSTLFTFMAFAQVPYDLKDKLGIALGSFEVGVWKGWRYIAAGDINGNIDYSNILNTPASLPPSGVAGGDLMGTYPAPKLHTFNYFESDTGEHPGAVIATDIPYNSNTFVYFEIKGFAYSTTYLPHYSIISFYNYANGGIMNSYSGVNLGNSIFSSVKAFINDGFVCLWIPTLAARTYEVRAVGFNYTYQTRESNNYANRVTSVVSSAVPDTAERVTEISIATTLKNTSKFGGDVSGTYNNLELAVNYALGDKKGGNALGANKLTSPVVITNFNTFNPESLDLKQGDIVPFISNNAVGKPDWDSNYATGYIVKTVLNGDYSHYEYVAYPPTSTTYTCAFAQYDKRGGGFKGWRYLAEGDVNGKVPETIGFPKLSGNVQNTHFLITTNLLMSEPVFFTLWLYGSNYAGNSFPLCMLVQSYNYNQSFNYYGGINLGEVNLGNKITLYVDEDGYICFAIPVGDYYAVNATVFGYKYYSNGTADPDANTNRITKITWGDIPETATKNVEVALERGLNSKTNFGGDITGTYLNTKISAGAVGTDELANLSVTAAKIKDGTINNGKLLAKTITSGAIADNTIIENNLAEEVRNKLNNPLPGVKSTFATGVTNVQLQGDSGYKPIIDYKEGTLQLGTDKNTSLKTIFNDHNIDAYSINLKAHHIAAQVDSSINIEINDFMQLNVPTLGVESDSVDLKAGNVLMVGVEFSINYTDILLTYTNMYMVGGYLDIRVPRIKINSIESTSWGDDQYVLILDGESNLSKIPISQFVKK